MENRFGDTVIDESVNRFGDHLVDDAPQEAPQQAQPITEGTMLDSVIEPAQAIAGGMAGMVLGGIGGIDVALNEGADAGANKVREITGKFAEFSAPTTQRGQRALETVGDLVQSGMDIVNFPLSGLAGLGAILTGSSPKEAADTCLLYTSPSPRD